MSNTRTYKRDTVKWIIAGIALIAVIVTIVLMIGSQCFTLPPEKWFGMNPDEQTEEVTENDQAAGGAVITEGESNGLALTSVRIAEEDYAAYGVSPLAETAYTLNASITPAGAYEQGITWSVEFVNPSSEWATGKSVSSYVTVTPSGENNHTATVECVLSFSEQIKVIATSVDNENVKAECLVDYGKRFRTTGGYVEASRTIGGTQTDTQQYNFNWSDVTTVDVESGGRNPVYSNSLSGSYTFSDGTITPSVTEEYVLQMSNGLKAALERQGLETTFTDRTVTPTTYLMFDRNCVLNLLGISYTVNPDEWTKLTAAIDDNSENYDFMIRYTVSSEYDSATTYARIKLNTATMLAVTDVTLDNNSIVF